MADNLQTTTKRTKLYFLCTKTIGSYSWINWWFVGIKLKYNAKQRRIESSVQPSFAVVLFSSAKSASGGISAVKCFKNFNACFYKIQSYRRVFYYCCYLTSIDDLNSSFPCKLMAIRIALFLTIGFSWCVKSKRMPKNFSRIFNRWKIKSRNVFIPECERLFKKKTKRTSDLFEMVLRQDLYFILAITFENK